MRSDKGNEDNSSSDEYDGKSKGTDAVEYSSCQHPVVLYLFLLFIVVALLVFVLNSSFQEVTNLLQDFVSWVVFRVFKGRFIYALILAVEAVDSGNAQSTDGD